jgi:HEPN domain-containing protein
MQDNTPGFDIENIIQHLIQSSEEDFNTMNGLFEIKRYSWALFLGHISLEKLLKALYMKNKRQHAPYIHNLFRLAELSEIEIPAEYADWLDKITTFNLKARYDDYKHEFYKICTPDYTSYWIEKIKILTTWINQML